MYDDDDIKSYITLCIRDNHTSYCKYTVLQITKSFLHILQKDRMAEDIMREVVMLLKILNRIILEEGE